AAALTRERVIEWDESREESVATERERVGAIVLRERPLRDADPAEVAAALAASIRRRGLRVLGWTAEASALRNRLAAAHLVDPDAFPDVSDEALLASLDTWLLPALQAVRGTLRLSALDLGEALL